MGEYRGFKELFSIPCLYRKNFQYILPLLDDAIPRQTFLPRSIRLAKDNNCKLIILFDAEDDWNELMKTEDNSNLNLGDVTLDINLKSEQTDNSGHTILTWVSIPNTTLNNISVQDYHDNDKEDKVEKQEDEKEGEDDVISGLPQNDEYLLALLRFDGWKSHDNDGVPNIEAIRGFLSTYSIVESQLRIAASGDYDVNILLFDIGARYHNNSRLWGIGARTGTFIMIDSLSNSFKKDTDKLIEESNNHINEHLEIEQEKEQEIMKETEPEVKQKLQNEQKVNENDRLEVINITERAVEATSEYVSHLAESRARSNERLARRLAQRRQSQNQDQVEDKHLNQHDEKIKDDDDDDDDGDGECNLDYLKPDYKSIESKSESISLSMVPNVTAEQLQSHDLPLVPPSSSSYESKIDMMSQPPPVPSFDNFYHNKNNNENDKEEEQYNEDFGSDNMDIVIQQHLMYMLKHCESIRPNEKQLRFIKTILTEQS